MRLQAQGIIHFDEKQYTKKHKVQDWKRYAVCNLDCDIDAYYRWWLMKRFGLKLNPPLRRAHVTIINDMVGRDFTQEQYLKAKEMFDGKTLNFEYIPSPKSNGEHWWLKVFSNDLLYIRQQAGLGRPHWGLHLTIGMPHPLHIEHSKYILDQCIRFDL